MGELTSAIELIKEDKNQFYIIQEKMKPLTDKYCRIMYKDDPEDIRSELTLALWEAINKISSYDNDAQVFTYLKNALTNKFHELYRNSRKHNDNEIHLSDEYFFNVDSITNDYKNSITDIDIHNFINQFTGQKRKVFVYIIIYGLSDSEISKKMDLSRQYINRMRRNLRKLLFDYFIK